MKFYEEPRICIVCQRLRQPTVEHHLIPGRPGRKLSTKYNLVAPICPECHEFIHGNDIKGIKTLKDLRKFGQQKAMAEQGWTEDEFRQVFGKSYL